MFKTFFISELKYLFRQAPIYVYTLFFIFTGFLIVINTGANEIVYANSPFNVNQRLLGLGLLMSMVIIHFFNTTALRDFKYEFHEILFTTPLSKSGYFLGRFCAVWLMTTIPFLGAYLGYILGAQIGPFFGLADASRLGPFYVETFISHYLLIALPNAFIIGSIIYAISSKWKSTMISFAGIFIILISIIIAKVLASNINYQNIVLFIDILGDNVYNIETRYYSAVEKNTTPSVWSIQLLYNRGVWIGLSALVLYISYRAFSFKNQNKKVRKKQPIYEKSRAVFKQPAVTTLFQTKTSWHQFKSFFGIHFSSIFKSITLKIILICSLIVFIIILRSPQNRLGFSSYPFTYRIIDGINSSSTDLFFTIMIIFFSGELIWRDRDVKINEVMDATAHSSLFSAMAKALSLLTIISIIHLSYIGLGILYQLINSYTHIEIDIYILSFLYDAFPKYLIYSCIVVLIQALLQNRYLGYFVSILILFAWDPVLNWLDISSNMLHIAGRPSITYSDLNGFGPGLKGVLWFNAYWVLFSLLCLFLAGSLWSRGSKKSLFKRFKSIRKQIPKNYRASIMATISIWLLVGDYVYYNTQVLNPYLSTDAQTQIVVNYEKRYKKYEHILLPKITDIKYAVDIFPSQRNVDAKAIITLTNENLNPIDELHFVLNDDWETEFTIPNSRLITEDVIYRIYKLDTSLQPGASIQIKIDAKYRTRGFENNRGETSIVNNGTMISNRDFVPFIGYQDRFELRGNSIRKEYGLSEKPRVAKLTKEVSENHMKNALGGRTSEFFNAETIISTSSDQTAIASGSLIKQWKKGNRNYYHYKTDTTAVNGHIFNSGRFEIAKQQWNDVAIEVYYDKKHPKNIQRMLDMVVHSLTYYTKNFGPYYHKHFRIIEVPRYVAFGGAASTGGAMLYSEAAGFIMNIEDVTKNNRVDAVVAHEISHQWWAHQITGANLQGRAMLHESLAEYSTLMVLKEAAKTPVQMQQFLENDHELYLSGRSRESLYESPLYKVEHQTYVSYGKGSIIFYALQDYIGEEKVNEALKNFIKAYGYKKPPYPSTLAFLDYLEPQIPDSLKYLVDDSFKKIVLYDNLLTGATYKKLKNGKYSVTMDIESNKIKVDSLGNETNVNINDWVDIGFFLDENETKLYHQKRIKIHKRLNKFTFELDTLPVKAAIDPRHLLIDKNYDDNIRVISEINN